MTDLGQRTGKPFIVPKPEPAPLFVPPSREPLETPVPERELVPVRR